VDNKASSDGKGEGAGGTPQPKGMVVYDPAHPPYERRHVCVLLRKVSDTLHGCPGEESSDEP